jgi:homoprotocatechuate degradation regulator HpaR
MALLRAREAVMKKFLPTLKQHDLSPQQWRVIRALNEQDGLEVSALAERCYLLLPSLSRILQNLEGRELVRRGAVPTDQRRSAIFITRKARRIFDEIAPKSEQRYQFITERFGYGKLELLYELLDELTQKLEDD